MSDSRVSEPTRASAVGVPMTHIEKVRLHTICVCTSVCQCPHCVLQNKFLNSRGQTILIHRLNIKTSRYNKVVRI